MQRPRRFIKLFLAVGLIVCAIGVSSGAGPRSGAQQSGQQDQLYKAAERHYAEGDYRKALDEIEELLKVAPQYASAFHLKYKALIGLFGKMPSPPPPGMISQEERLERKIKQARLLKEAGESLEMFLRLKPDSPYAELLRDQLDALRVFAEPAVKPESEWTLFSSAEVTEKARILHRPQPRFPEEARQGQVNGSVKLLAVLAADGTVKHPLVIKSLGYGTTESAIEAARRIRFEPATKGGRPVSTSVQIEYHFNTY
ncbi:MAG TPA: energy transducer TonB [Pyrinomonadaceae bacterium]